MILLKTLDLNILGINSAYKNDGEVSIILRETLEACATCAANWTADSKNEKEELFINQRIQTLHLMDFVKFTAPQENYVPPELQEAVDVLMRADIVVFASPVIWFNPSPLLMQFFVGITALEHDWNFPLKGKIAGVITHCDEDGCEKVANDIRAPLQHFGFQMPPHSTFWRNRAGARFSEAHWQVDDHQKVMAVNLIHYALTLKKARKDAGEV